MNDQLAKPLTESERRASRQALNQLHPGNRFRLMAGLSMLPENPKPPLKSEKPA
jgi:hypothetical protein